MIKAQLPNTHVGDELITDVQASGARMAANISVSIIRKGSRDVVPISAAGDESLYQLIATAPVHVARERALANEVLMNENRTTTVSMMPNKQAGRGASLGEIASFHSNLIRKQYHEGAIYNKLEL
uniref:Uncharacterized protein n=1 Tax=Parascaris univalens TaxID=6257 RepID=A0A914ZXL9_PARUN